MRPKVSFGRRGEKRSVFSNRSLFWKASFFSKNESCKRKRNARRVHNASRIKLPFLSLCFLVVYFPLLRAVLLERLLDRGDRSSLLQREDVFFGRFPVVIFCSAIVFLFFKPPLLYSSKAQQKQNEKKKDRRRQNFSCLVKVALGKARLCVLCVCVCARDTRGTR